MYGEVCICFQNLLRTISLSHLLPTHYSCYACVKRRIDKSCILALSMMVSFIKAALLYNLAISNKTTNYFAAIVLVQIHTINAKWVSCHDEAIKAQWFSQLSAIINNIIWCLNWICRITTNICKQLADIRTCMEYEYNFYKEPQQYVLAMNLRY